MSDDVTPNEMPGADAATEPSEPTPVTEPEAEAPKPKSTDTVGFWKSKAREQEKRAKENFGDAEKWREMVEKVGGGDKPNFDPQAEIDKIRAELTSERTERLRIEVARTTGVDPEDIKGDTEEDMRASAERWQARFQARLDEALKSKQVPAAAPAAEVTSSAKVSGNDQITSLDEYNAMSSSERMAAYKDGRLDELMGRKS